MAGAGGRTAISIGTALAVVAAGVGIVVASGVLVVGARVLDEELYAEALDRTDAYDRVYTEVLADPELADTTEALLGGLEVDRLDPESARILGTTTLRLVLPPERLQAGTEAVVAGLLAYLRGDTRRLDTDVDLSPTLAGIERAAVSQARGVLASIPTRPVPTLDGYREALALAGSELRRGRLPDALPVPGPSIVDDDVLALLEEVSGGRLDPDVEITVRALLEAGSDADALTTALAPVLEARAAEVVADLRAELEDGRELDVTGAIAERAGESRSRVVGELNGVRDAVDRYRSLALVAAALLVVAGVAAVLSLHRRDVARAVLWLASCLVLGGVGVLAAWLAIRHTVTPPLAPATGTGDGTWNLPAGIRAVVRDVEAAIADDLQSHAARAARVVALLGLGVAAMVAAMRVRVRLLRLVLAGSGVAAAVLLVASLADPRDPPRRACNGHVELCERRYDEVVQFATHNSMSSPDVVQVWPEHDGTISDQLAAGVRTLLIDAHYWRDLLSAEELARADPSVPVSVAERVADVESERLRGREGVFLCHNLCAWGGRPFVDGLEDVRRFLDANPREVVTIVLQDEVERDDVIAAFRAADLERYAYRHDHADEWPTLGELVERGERLVVFAENSGPPPQWYAAAFEVIADTPFRFREPSEMSCAPNRGPDDAPLLMMNHWLTRSAPDRAAAAQVNTRDAIVERARRCEAERGKLPNFVAVDFFGIGDVRGAVDELNGLGG
jgi:hypothetical protein